MKNRLPLALLLAALLGGCHPQPTETGERFAPLPANTFKLQWTVPLQLAANDPLTNLYLRDDLLFAYSKDHTVYQIQRDVGRLTKAYRPVKPELILRPPVLSGKYIAYPTSLTVEVYERNGHKVKTITLDDNVSSAAAGENNRIVLGEDHVNGGRIQEIDLEDPYDRPGWPVMTLGRVSAAPAVTRGMVFAGSQDGKVYAMLIETGRGVWPPPGTFSTNGPILADLAVEELALYVPSSDGRLYCINASTMQLTWQYFAGQALKQAVVVTPSAIYLPVPSKGIICLNKGPVPLDKAADPVWSYNRQPRWASTDIKQILSEDEQHVYAATNNNAIVALDKATGTLKFRSKRSDYQIFATNTKDATIYAAASDGRIVAITPVLKPGVVGEIVLEVHPLGPFVAAD